MKIDKNNYYYGINTIALSEAFKFANYEINDPILFLELYLPSYYERIVNNNDISIMQELIDNSNCKGKIYSIKELTGAFAVETRNWSRHRLRSKKIICLIKKSDTLNYSFVEVELGVRKVKQIRTLCSFDKSNMPVILWGLPRSYHTDFHFINKNSFKVQLYGLIHFFFIFGNDIYFSAVTRSKRQSVFQIGSFLSNVSILFSELCDLNQDEINVKINISSPGGILFYIESGLSVLESHWESVLLINVLIFGGSYTNGDKVYELFSVKNLIAKIFNEKYNRKMREYQLKEREIDLQKKKLEVEEEMIRLEQKKRELQKQESDYNVDLFGLEDSVKKFESTLDSISETASQIDIAIPNDGLIDINEIMEILDTPCEELE